MNRHKDYNIHQHMLEITKGCLDETQFSYLIVYFSCEKEVSDPACINICLLFYRHKHAEAGRRFLQLSVLHID